MRLETLIVTDRFEPSPRMLLALWRAGAGPDGAPATGLATFSQRPEPGLARLEGRGVLLVPLGRMGAATVELALLGAVRALRPSRLVIFAAPRALAALSGVRQAADPPDIEVHLPLEETSTWDETGVVAVRAMNLVDGFMVEDDATAERLLRIGARPDRIERWRWPAPAGPATSGRTLVVHGASFERSRTAARDLARDLPGSSCVTFGGVFAGLLEDRLAPGTVVFTERLIPTAAPIALMRQAGWRVVAPRGPATEARGSDPGTIPLDQFATEVPA